MTQADGLDAAIDALYAGPPAEFVAGRDALAAQARAAGDRAGASRIKALRRPTVGAWYLNLAARDGLTSLRELLKLGPQLRQAQADGDFAALRELAARRGPLVGRVVRDLTAHLAELGTTATPSGLDEVRATLASALADADVAGQLADGRLDRAHHYSGFGDLPTVAAAPRQPDADREPAPEQSGRELAGRELAAAEAALAEAAADAEDARHQVEKAEAVVAALEADLAGARERLADLTGGHATARERERAAAEAVESARRRLADS